MIAEFRPFIGETSIVLIEFQTDFFLGFESQLVEVLQRDLFGITRIQKIGDFKNILKPYAVIG